MLYYDIYMYNSKDEERKIYIIYINFCEIDRC